MLRNKILTLSVYFFSIVTVLNISGCAVTNHVWPPYDKISISADEDVNFDLHNRPSPVQVKVYELSSRTTFDNLDFDGLFNHEEAQLRGELLSKTVFFLQPREHLKLKIELQNKTAFIAILAAYRDIDNSKWKHVYKVKSHGHYRHTITLGSNGIIAGKVTEDTNKQTIKTGASTSITKTRVVTRKTTGHKKRSTTTTLGKEKSGKENVNKDNAGSAPTLTEKLGNTVTDKIIEKVTVPK
ncbi:MAG: type VI secretion system lipoprotein TssJ [Gammaproteobacteria bacterium]|nr:type VI secretion system lipoprotein TssJ [Gammaproteobacteria bacterium]